MRHTVIAPLRRLKIDPPIAGIPSSSSRVGQAVDPGVHVAGCWMCLRCVGVALTPIARLGEHRAVGVWIDDLPQRSQVRRRSCVAVTALPLSQNRPSQSTLLIKLRRGCKRSGFSYVFY